MFDTIVTKIRNAIRAIGAATLHTLWLATLAILALFPVW